MQGQDITFHILVVVTALLFGFGGLIRGFQMLNRGRLDLISDWNNRPLPNPAEYAKPFARVYIGIGSLFLLLPLLLWLSGSLLLCGIVAGVLVWYWFEAIDKIAERARRASHRLTV